MHAAERGRRKPFQWWLEHSEELLEDVPRQARNGLISLCQNIQEFRALVPAVSSEGEGKGK